MKKLLIISPHFSTGGAPQVTLNKVELLQDHFEIMVVEHAFLAWNYVVQRNKVINILGGNFKSLGENKRELLDFIDTFNPDVISMEEFPEMFMDNDLAREIYSEDRTYRIVETTHDSSFNPDNKIWMPDEFVFVSAYNVFKYSHLEIPMRVIEYPVNLQVDKRDKKVNLYLDVCIVGLWTQRKNQGYAIEMARHLVDYNVKFHFLGNQAGNFESYWKPLMENLPDNCIVHGESNNVPKFIKGCDMFLFPSKGDRGNKELNPIAIKEALEYPHIPKMMFNLDVYCNKYNDYRDVVYLSGDSYTDSVNMRTILNLQEKNNQLIVIGTYPNTDARIKLTIDCINSAKKMPFNRPIMLVSHYPVPKKIQEMVDYYIYDQHNPLTHHSYYNRFYREDEEAKVEMKITGNSNQSLTVLTNLINAGKAAKAFGFNKMFYVTFDIELDEKDFPAIYDRFSKLDNEWQAVLATLNTPFGKGIQTNGMFFNTDFVGKLLDDVRTPEEYNKLCESIGAHNFLEDYMMKKVQKTHGVWVEYPNMETFLEHSGHGTSSNSEYVGIVKNEEWDINYFYFYSYNESIPYYYIKQYNKDGNLLYTEDFAKQEKYIPLVYDAHKVELVQVENDYIRTYYVDDIIGSINIKDTPVEIERPKIKLVHIQTTLNDEREQLSRASLEQVRDKGWEYILHVNEPYTSLPPIHNCNRPQAVSMELFDEATVAERSTALTPAHYGCYLAFKDAILGEFDDCDYLIVCEGDCLIEGDVGSFQHKVEKCALMLEKNNIGFMSFGDKDTLEFGWPQSPVVREVNDDMYITDHLIGMQCIMFPKFVKSYLKNKLRTHPWDAADMYFNSIFYGSGYNMGIVYERMTTQADGYSLIDQQFKTFRK
jgi:hypothetical protein